MKLLFLIAVVLCCSCASKHKTVATTQNKNTIDSIPNYDYGMRMYNPSLGRFIPIK